MKSATGEPIPSWSVEDLAVINEREIYTVERGEYDIMVGPDSRDYSLLKASFRVL